MLRKILIGLLILFLAAQFIQPPLNQGKASSPQDITRFVHTPDTVLSLLKTACFDCHSNHTNYPWYSRITPVNWWLKNHVEEGKKHLNFTLFGQYNDKRRNKKLEEIVETVEDHTMPLDSYLWIHREANLNDAQRKLIIEWADNSR